MGPDVSTKLGPLTALLRHCSSHLNAGTLLTLTLTLTLTLFVCENIFISRGSGSGGSSLGSLGLLLSVNRGLIREWPDKVHGTFALEIIAVQIQRPVERNTSI